jgi:hypothetical protein
MRKISERAVRGTGMMWQAGRCSTLVPSPGEGSKNFPSHSITNEGSDASNVHTI